MSRENGTPIGSGSLAVLVTLARDALRRIAYATAESSAASLTTQLRIANALATQGALLLAIARELEARAYEDLGRFSVEAVERGARARDTRSAAELVAEAFLGLHRAG